MSERTLEQPKDDDIAVCVRVKGGSVEYCESPAKANIMAMQGAPISLLAEGGPYRLRGSVYLKADKDGVKVAYSLA